MSTPFGEIVLADVAFSTQNGEWLAEKTKPRTWRGSAGRVVFIRGKDAGRDVVCGLGDCQARKNPPERVS